MSPAGISARPRLPKGIVGYRPRRPSMYSLEHPLRAKPRQGPGLSGAEKRRKRKGGNPKGGPGQGGVQGALRRLAAAVREAQS